MGFDAGILYKINQNITLGINAQNVGRTSLGEDKIPTNIKAGAALKLLSDKLILAGDFDSEGSSSSILHFGAEYFLAEQIALRAGSNDGDLTFGIGVGFSGYKLDYAYLKHDLQNTQRISISYSPLKKEVKKVEKVEVEKPKEDAKEKHKIIEKEIIVEKVEKLEELLTKEQIKPEEKVVEKPKVTEEIKEERVEKVEKPKEIITSKEEMVEKKEEKIPEVTKVPEMTKKLEPAPEEEIVVKATIGKKQIIVNNKEINLTNPVEERNDVIFINITDELFKTVGANYEEFKGEEGLWYISVDKASQRLSFKIGKNEVEVYHNGKFYSLYPLPYISKGEFMIPLSRVYQLLGIKAKVNYSN